MKLVEGFSKKSKEAKIDWIVENYFEGSKEVKEEFMSYWHSDESVQKSYDEFSENTLSNYYMPFGVVPNFLINDKIYCLPFVIEESSVVAAAGKSAKYWFTRGGFKTKVISTTKIGQVHFLFSGNKTLLKSYFPELKKQLLEGGAHLTINMDARGGGVLDIELVDLTNKEPDYFQLKVSFDTRDSMGANFINTVLEEYSFLLKEIISKNEAMGGTPRTIMSIVSNYTPDCIVRAWVECPIEDLGTVNGFSAEEFAEKFRMGIRIAEIDPHRATTNNKGIYNGVDAMVIATGNDFRAVEACGHTFAAKDGQYRGLTHVTIDNGTFKYWIDLPMAVGTVGGLTILHPLVKRALQMIGNPNSEELMQLIAVAGLAQNFAAVKSLVTVGIQQGHMKMHLLNIMNSFHASEEEKKIALEFFKDKVVSYTSVRALLAQIRGVEILEIN